MLLSSVIREIIQNVKAFAQPQCQGYCNTSCFIKKKKSQTRNTCVSKDDCWFWNFKELKTQWGKWGNTGYKHFLFFPQYFRKAKTHSSYYMILWFPDFSGCKPYTRKVNVSSSNHEVSTFWTLFRFMTVVYINAVQYQTCPNHESDNHFFAKIPGGVRTPGHPLWIRPWVVLGFNTTLTAKVISWRSVTHMCFLAFSHQY